MKTIQEVANHYGVTYTAVRKWIDKGLPYTVKKSIGRKPTMMLDLADVEAFHKSKESYGKLRQGDEADG